jgi:hypothetical protein
VGRRFRGNDPNWGQARDLRPELAALLVLAVALLLLPALARGQAPLRHSASAFGHVLQTDFIGAGEAGPNGEDPVGSLTLSGFLNFQTQTTCLNLSGNAVVSGGRILTGRDAGKGFLSSSIDHGPPVNGKPVDVTVFSGLLPRPPRNCPSPGDAPPEQMRDTGGGPFTSGDLVVVDAIERLPAGSPTARVRVLGLGMGRPRGVLVATQTGPSVRVRVCGAPGVALLRLTQRTSPPGRKAPTWVRASWQDERRQDRPCQIHRVSSPVASSGVGRHRIRVRARTTGRRWSREAERTFDLGCWSRDGRRRRGETAD